MQAQMDDMLVMANQTETMITTMETMIAVMKELTGITHNIVAQTKAMVTQVIDLREKISNFDDYFRPIRSYFYWEKHCFRHPDVLVSALCLRCTGRRRYAVGRH